MWVEFVVGSLLCSERFSSGYSAFPLSSKTNNLVPRALFPGFGGGKKTNISKFQFDLERTDTFKRVHMNFYVLRG